MSSYYLMGAIGLLGECGKFNWANKKILNLKALYQLKENEFQVESIFFSTTAEMPKTSSLKYFEVNRL